MTENQPTPPPLQPQAQTQPNRKPIPDQPPLEESASFAGIFEGLLKQPHGLIKTIRSGEGPPALVTKLSLMALGGFLLFAFVLGNFSMGSQLWAAPVKIVGGIVFSALICFPSLYIFTALTGTTLKLPELMKGLAACLTLIAALLLGFAPVLWVFSQSTDSVPFFGFLVLVVWLIAFFFGTGLLEKMLLHTETTKTSPLKVWVAVFLLVTLQMSTTLRPIIGNTGPFLTTEKRSFIEHWLLQLSGENCGGDYKKEANYKGRH